MSALLPGMEIDRIEIDRNGRLGGIPHSVGTQEYLTCVKGSIRVAVLGMQYQLEEGDVFAIPGDQPHSYQNVGDGRAVGFSVVVIAPRLGYGASKRASLRGPARGVDPVFCCIRGEMQGRRRSSNGVQFDCFRPSRARFWSFTHPRP